MTPLNELPRKGFCEGNQDKCGVQTAYGKCPLFGALGKANYKDGKRRVKGCNDPTARGKRNRAKGDGKARKVRKALNLQGVNSRHEEHWGGHIRVEVKAGAQISPITTRFELAERQSEMARPLGDTRPFAMVAMPDGQSDGIVLMRLSQFANLALLLEEDR
jgi:hypothetical protein